MSHVPLTKHVAVALARWQAARAAKRRPPRGRGQLVFRVCTAGFLVAGVLGALATPAAASTDYSSISAPFTGASDFVTGIPSCSGAGPAGLLNDGRNFFVADGFCSGTLYKLPMTGGNVSSAQSAPAGVFGLGYNDGTYFAAPEGGQLETFNPSSLATAPTLVNLPCGAMDIVGDPLSNALYVSSLCGIYYVANPTSLTPTVTEVSPNNDFYDGLAVTADGQHLWAADYLSENIVELSPTGALQQSIYVGSTVNGPDGIAIAPPGTIVNGLDVSNNVFVNDNDGTILRIDTNHNNALSLVASGGTRGDFATVGPDGCLYVTQSDRVEKLTPCFFASSLAASYSARVTNTATGIDTGDLGLSVARQNATSSQAIASVPLPDASLVAVGENSAHASSSATTSTSSATSSSRLIGVDLLGGAIRASALTASATAGFDFAKGTGSASAARSSFAGLVVDGHVVAEPVAPNTTIVLPGLGQLVLNEQTKTSGSSFDAIEVHMIDFRSTDGATGIVVGSAFAAGGTGYAAPALAAPLSLPSLPNGPPSGPPNPSVPGLPPLPVQPLLGTQGMLQGVSCATAATCVAVGWNYNNTSPLILSTTNAGAT